MNPDALQLLQHAAQQFSVGRLDDAESICRKLVDRYPQAVDVLHLLALVRKQSGDTAEAEQLLRTCLALDPRRAELHANLGNLLGAAGRMEEAERAYRDALSNDAFFRPARLGLARLLKRAGAFAEAESEARKLIDGDEHDAEAWHVLGSALQAGGRSVNAEAAWRRALAIKPHYGIAHHNLGAMLGEAGRSEEALSELDNAAAAGVKGPGIDFSRASTLMTLYRFDEAERLLADSIRADPRQLPTQRLLARIRFMRGARDFADEFGSAVRRYPDDVSLRIGYAQALRGAGRLQDARAALQEALPRQAGDPRLPAELAATWQEAGDFGEALRHARKALILAPDDTGFNELLIDALVALGRAREAMPVIEGLRRRAPLNQWYVAMEATAARLLGDPRYRDYCDYENLVQSFALIPPAGWSSIEAFHRELIPVLKERHKFHAEPLDQSLRSGTQTPRSLLGDPEPVIQAFLQALHKPIDEYRERIGFAAGHPFKSRNRGEIKFAGCWSVLLKRGGYHVNHVHTGGWISSAYYVEVPPESADNKTRSGWLKFGQPRFRVPGADPEKLVRPEPGKLLLFPAYLWHGTTPVISDDSRLTIAFDAVPEARETA